MGRIKINFILFICLAVLYTPGWAQASADSDASQGTMLEDKSAPMELNPLRPDMEELLRRFDNAYEEQTGKPSHIGARNENLIESGCYRQACYVWIDVDKASQSAELYINGNPAGTWLVSTGKPGRETPDFDRHPNGRIYDTYTSIKFPEGDYEGLGNMPYAVFIEGGFALHGTPKENWRKLGHRASHGCVRQHPDNAYRFNRLVRKFGIREVWITVR